MVGEDDAAREGDFEAVAMAEGGVQDSSRGESEFSCLDETVHGGAVVGDDLGRESRLQNISGWSSDVEGVAESGGHC